MGSSYFPQVVFPLSGNGKLSILRPFLELRFNLVFMSKKARILVVDSDLHTLSKIYLGLIHKNYKVEATDDANEIIPRTERFKPRLIILRTSARNLTTEVYREIAQKRIHVFLINDSNAEIPVEIKKSEQIEMPVNMNWLDEKIREVLGIVEL